MDASIGLNERKDWAVWTAGIGHGSWLLTDAALEVDSYLKIVNADESHSRVFGL